MAHPLFDRHAVTEARTAPPAVALPTERERVDLTETNNLLRRIVEAERAEIAQLCVSDREPPEALMANFPCPGSKRYIVRRTGNGGTYTVPATTPTLIVPANEARLGGLITVSGTTGVTLILTSDLLIPASGQPLSGGAAQLWVPPNGAWDFRLGPQMLWAGNVIAYATAQTTALVAEV